MKKLHLRKNQAVRIIYTLVILLVLSAIIPAQIASAGNDSWTSAGLLGATIHVIKTNPNNPQELLIGIENIGSSNIIYRSTNGGTSWIPSSSGLLVSGITDIAYNENNSNIVYASTGAGIYKSLDSGLSWQQVGPPTIFTEIEVDPTNGSVVYAGAAFVEGDSALRGIWKSTDGGNTWMHIMDNSAFGSLPFSSMKIAPSNPHVLYAGGGLGLYKSTDSGQTWVHADGGFFSPPVVSTLAVDPYSSSIVYMRGGTTLYKTTDGGDSWIPISAGLGGNQVLDIEVDPGNQQIIYVGTAGVGGGGGVYRSTDSSGTSWVSMNAGMGGTSISSLAMDKSNPQNIYAGGYTSGVWKYTFLTSGQPDNSISINNGALFTNQTNVTLKITAPPGTTEMMISNDGGFAGSSWETFSNSKAWTITSYGSYTIPRTVYAKFKTYGQVSGLYQDDIILDVTPPSGTVSISGVSKNAQLDSLATVTANLQLSATDDVSGVGEMMISSHSDFSGALWEPYSAAKAWQTDTTGAVTAYVKFKDNAGNLSSVACATNGATPCAGTFGDVFPDYWANSYIERLYSAGITGGCALTPLTYCPDATVTRAQMAVFLLRGMHGSSFTPTDVGTSTGFGDVATSHWAAAWIKQLAAEGITSGCGAGNYCPEATVTRAQMAVFLLKAKHGSSYSPLDATGVFTDVPVGYWADKWIEQLAAERITSGCGAGVYCPDNSVTRAQMAVFLVKTFNLP